MFDEETRTAPKMNLTPLIDIIFLLVVFFMLSTSFVKLEALNMFVAPEKPHNAKLSKSAAAGQAAPQKFNSHEVVLRIDKLGVQVDGIAVPEDVLAKLLADALQNSAGAKLKIVTGKGVPVQKLVEMIDLAQNAGAKDVQVQKD